MKAIENNPSGNSLGAGLNAADISAAVSTSGYPLQLMVAKCLREQFELVEEEWSYIDRHTHEARTIDILAEKALWQYHRQPRVRPELTLIVECKQSVLPYVFFLTSSKPRLPHFPLVAGLFKQDVAIISDDDPSTWQISVQRALGLDAMRFAVRGPEYCTSFTKCVRQGSKLDLSGVDPFQGLVLPLLKAMQYFQTAEAPSETAQWFDCHVVIAVGVLDAPMVAVRLEGGSHQLLLLPWVRIVRHEPDIYESPVPSGWYFRRETFVIDVVHKDFLPEYVEQHLLPFGEECARLVQKHQEVLAAGQAFAAGMGQYGLIGIEDRLQPRATGASLRRYGSVLKRIVGFLAIRKAVD